MFSMKYAISMPFFPFISSFCTIAGEFLLSNGSIEVDRKDSMQTVYEYLMTFFFYISGFMIPPQRIPWFFLFDVFATNRQFHCQYTHTHSHTYICNIHISSFDRIITFFRWFFIQYSTLLSLTVQKVWFFFEFHQFYHCHYEYLTDVHLCLSNQRIMLLAYEKE